MGLEDHKKDYVSDFWRGRRWQMGHRKGHARQAAANRWLAFGSLDRRGKATQVGHVSFSPARQVL